MGSNPSRSVGAVELLLLLHVEIEEIIEGPKSDPTSWASSPLLRGPAGS